MAVKTNRNTQYPYKMNPRARVRPSRVMFWA